MDGVDILQAAEMPGDDDELPSAAPRGFSNPDVLKAAQETRARNRATREGVDYIPGGEPLKTTRSRGANKKTERNLKGIEQMLVAIHFMVATATGVQELAIDKEESQMLAEALATLADHYKIKLDGKTGALMGFVYALSTVYGPRAVAIGVRLRSERKNVNTNPVP